MSVLSEGRAAAWLWLDFIPAVVQWLALLVVRLVLIVVGLVVVAFAIPFAVPGYSLSDGRLIVNLPRWAWLFGNDFDGLDGDKRQWWADNCDALVLFGLFPLARRLGVPVEPLPVTSWLSRWWWAAVRNPVNNLRLVAGISCPVAECDFAYLGQYSVEDKPGKGGWQFVRATRRGGLSRWYGFYAVRELSSTTARVVRLGFKIKPEHQGSAEPAKGMTFKVNLAKEI
ncbi:hypothetical protein FBY06_14020 [Pseudomonas sp. SJZ085]|uniref:DUF7338 family protein n=1 Tax=unclassified Pseudomonas TaxID=196821 RepID=UPI00119AB83B|nr:MULTISPECIES: hypothetical protein [unclassified Pseudomonas]TWC12016.1 hypothetical protein FBX99_13920 [Pseudomonas sp. SJZ074]TWC30597.1 hypothetical protein FBY06_14020 [Pseudomonas sp. SJZ085]